MFNLHRLAFLSLAIFVFAIPWERNVAIPGVGAAGAPFAALAMLLGVASIIDGRKIRLRAPSLFMLVFGGFVLWSTLSYFWSINPGATAVRSMTYFELLLMVWLVWQMTRTQSEFKVLLQSFVFGSLFAILIVLIEFLQGDATTVNTVSGLSRFSFAGGDPNYFALSLVLALPMAWILFLLNQNRILNFLNLLYIPLAIIVIGLTGSRGGTISALLALTVIPATYWYLTLWRKVLLVAALSVTVVGALFVIPQVTFQRLINTPDAIANEDLASRTDIWRAGFRFLAERESAVLIGAGSATYGSAIESTYGRRSTGHNAYLNILVENGLVGLSLFLSLFAIALLPNLTARPSIRNFSAALCISLAVGIFALSWEREKPLWFVLALLSTQQAVVITFDPFAPQPRRGDRAVPHGSPPIPRDTPHA